ncbi:MAG TPA: hypothetical protein VNU94_09390 [Acidobacteriaceae bacterium]|nr:hypothetical protein [Acidobacteriaceae bacterium]
MHTNDHEKHVIDPENPGYETTDINVGGIIVFLAGLAGSVLVFFVFCFGMGKVINDALKNQDGASDRWHQVPAMDGNRLPNGDLDNLASNPRIEQQQLQTLTNEFPQPRIETDDGNQDIADLHAREDLLLEHYSYVDGKPGAVRIPIERAMELIAQRGLPTAPQVAAGAAMTGANAPVVTAPLTNGFARTGFELDAIEAREQKMKYASNQ